MFSAQNFEQVNKLLLKGFPASIALKEAYNLDRIQKLTVLLGKPQDQIKVIHVAGTSGKTSTCYYMAALLQQAGKKVGLTVSPHVEEVNERVQINLTPLPEKQFCAYFNEFLMIEGVTDLKPTYFELMVAFAYWVFAFKEKVDYAVVEVGVGGLGDSTNVVSRPDKVCIITDIGYDHMHILGDTIEKIAQQKAGIIKPHNQVFTPEQSSQVLQVIKTACQQKSGQLKVIKEAANNSLLPPFAWRDWQLAKAAYQFVARRDGLPELSEQQQLDSQVVVPARMEVFKLQSGQTVILDGSHNQQKLGALAEGLRQRFGEQPLALLMGFVASRTDRLQEASQQIVPLAKKVIVTPIDMQTSEQDVKHQSADPEFVKQACLEAGAKDVSVVDSPLDGLQALLKRPEKLLLITGSFYLMNQIRPKLRQLTKND